ncbi:MAG TPA: pyrroline-5-carboxylate reductase [Acidimicrobiaceae bacterium]|nr:pyrroline-5-carboxylate reductase [Acidimicrobiaceae bacterium]
MTSPKLQFIGGGKMAEALLGGMIATGWAAADEIHVVEPSAERRAILSDAHPSLSIGDAPVVGVDAVLAVKPQIAPGVFPDLAAVSVPRMLSIAAGITTAAMEAALPEGTVVVRSMPNTPALVGQGMAAIAPGAHAGDDDLVWATSILAAVGRVVTVAESDLDAVTGVSGSGPAYVFHLAEALTAAGIAQGLGPEVADTLTRQTLLGAATLLSDSGEDPAQLRINVTSPNGTTHAGLEVMYERGFADVIDAVVAAATARSAELGS